VSVSLVEVTRSPPTDWDRILSESNVGHLFHTAEWAEYRATTASLAPLYFVAGRSDGMPRSASVALGLEVPLLGRRLRPMAWRLAFDSSPVPAERRAGFIEALLQWARRRRGLVSIECGSLDGDWGTDLLETPQQRLEFVADVSGGHSLERMRKSTRYEVRRAAREGVTVSLAQNRADVEAFVTLHAATLADLVRRKHVSGARAPFDTIAAAIERLIAGGVADVFLAHRDGSPIGACLFGYAGRDAYYLLNGSSALGREYAATHLIISTALDEFRARQFAQVNLGGVPADSTAAHHPDHGLYLFKKGFGGEVVPRVGGTVVLRSRRSRAIRLARQPLKRGSG
jgi:FemAB family